MAGGRGSVEFGRSSAPESGLANTGLESVNRRELTSGIAFYDIEDPEGVADLVERLRAADRS